MLDETELRALIRDIPDFPEPGILYRDITPLLHNAEMLRRVNDELAAHARRFGATLIAGIEARGFLFGTPVAERLGVPFVPVRKPGKLPAEAASVSYALEYGEDTLEMHRDPGVSGHRVAIIDDLLATGGTAAAAAQLIQSCDGTVAGAAFVIDLGDLGGRAALEGYAIAALTTY
jgi:adenine phosphoribosyltransferase